MDKKLIISLLKENNKLQLQKTNKESTKKIDYSKIELEACYDVIKELNEKNGKSFKRKIWYEF